MPCVPALAHRCVLLLHPRQPSAAAQSPRVPLPAGIALDGKGIYGAWESAGEKPDDLDACGGHYGPTPGTASMSSQSGLSATSGITGLAASANVYHYVRRVC